MFFYMQGKKMKTRFIILIIIMTAVMIIMTQCSPTTVLVPTNTSVPEKPTDVPAAEDTLTPSTSNTLTQVANDTPTSVASDTAAPAASDTPALIATHTSASAALDGQALAQKACTACHTFDRIQNARKTNAEWTSTVQRMVGKGAQLIPDEQQAVIDYLSKTYPK
jgi:hypothetical protein